METQEKKRNSPELGVNFRFLNDSFDSACQTRQDGDNGSYTWQSFENSCLYIVRRITKGWSESGEVGRVWHFTMRNRESDYIGIFIDVPAQELSDDDRNPIDHRSLNELVNALVDLNHRLSGMDRTLARQMAQDLDDEVA